MGDVKLSILVAFTLGLGGMPDFLLGMAVAVIMCIAYKILKMPVVVNKLSVLDSVFPMCAAIMFGFCFALTARHVPFLNVDALYELYKNSV